VAVPGAHAANHTKIAATLLPRERGARGAAWRWPAADRQRDGDHSATHTSHDTSTGGADAFVRRDDRTRQTW